MKPLLVGQAPGQHIVDPDTALGGRSGARLASLCGLSIEDFLERFERVNLVDYFPGKAGKGDAFPLDIGMRKADEIMADPANSGRHIVVMGGAAMMLFRLTGPSLTFAPHAGALYAWCPHPSGVNRWWNDSDNKIRARKFWTQLAHDAASTLR